MGWVQKGKIVDTKAKISLLSMAAAMAPMLTTTQWDGERTDTRHYSPRKQKQGGSNPMRGYYARYSHVLTEYVSQKNLAKKANGKGFKGFRKVRVNVPGIGTVWMRSEFAEFSNRTPAN